MRKFINFTNRSMFERIWSNYDNHQLAKKSPQVLCTISGGQDSIVNFFILLGVFYAQRQKNLVEKKTNNMQILYCQHFWQLKNFFLTFFIFRVSFLFQIPFFLVLAENRFLNENRSRGWRKKIFYRVCRLEKITCLVTGHTETDTVEKNFNNLFRGTSAKGLMDFNLLSQKKTQTSFFSTLILKSYFYEKHSFGYQGRFSTQSNFFFYYKENLECPRLTNFLTISNNFDFFQIEKEDLKKFFHDSKNFVYTNNRLRNQNYHGKFNLQSMSFCFYSKTLNQKVNFNKPLQNIRRSTISELVNFFKFPLLLDFTNYSSSFSRNKIRHEILPFIKSRYHKKVENLLGNFFQTISLDHIEIERQTSEILFLYQILPFIYFQNPQFSRKRYLPEKLERSFLQKMIVDYKNIELLFSQLSGIQTSFFLQ